MADSQSSKSTEIPEGEETIMKEPVILKDATETEAVESESTKEENASKGANIVATDVGAVGEDSEQKDKRSVVDVDENYEFRLSLGSLSSTKEDVRPKNDRSTRANAERITAAFSEAFKDVEEILEETGISIELCKEYDQIRDAMGKVLERYCSLKRILRDMEGIVLDENLAEYKEECERVYTKVKALQREAKEAMEKIDQRWENESIRSHSTQKSSGSRRSSVRSSASKRSSSSRGSGLSNNMENSLTVQNLAKLRAGRELRQKQVELDFEAKKKQAELDIDREIVETEAVLKVCEKAEGVLPVLREDCEVPKKRSGLSSLMESLHSGADLYSPF